MAMKNSGASLQCGFEFKILAKTSLSTTHETLIYPRSSDQPILIIYVRIYSNLIGTGLIWVRMDASYK